MISFYYLLMLRKHIIVIYVILNLFQNPNVSTHYKTLKRVQGDKPGFPQQKQIHENSIFVNDKRNMFSEFYS